MVNHQIDENPRLVNSVVPNVPTWAVYYLEDTDELITEPVLFFNVWEKKTEYKGKATKHCEIEAVPFYREYLEEEESQNFLGLSLTASPDQAVWEGEIRDIKAKIARAMTAANDAQLRGA